MNILEFAAATFSPQLPDGRFVFRPWGPRGPCYLLSARQRAVRGGMQLALYALAAAALFFVPVVTAAMNNLIVFAVVFMLSNYALYWLFSIGLPKIDNPPPMTPEQRREYIAVQSDCFNMLQKRVPVMELGAPEFCVFYDMFAFDTLFRVGQGRRRIPR